MAATAKKTNWFAIWVSAAVVVALVIVTVLVVWMNNAATAPVEAPAAGSINEETGGITIGDGPDELETWIDFMCPYCGQFERTWGDEIHSLVEEGELTLTVYPVGMLDNASQGTEYSTRAANAMYCVTEENPDAAYPFMRELFENQPQEGTPGLTDAQLIDIAEKVDAGDAADCITERTYADFVAQTTESIPENPQGQVGTPSVILNGDQWLNWSGDPETELLPKLQG